MFVHFLSIFMMEKTQLKQSADHLKGKKNNVITYFHFENVARHIHIYTILNSFNMFKVTYTCICNIMVRHQFKIFLFNIYFITQYKNTYQNEQ